MTYQEIQNWKNIALSVNNKFSQNTNWKLAEDAFGTLDANGNSLIESLLDSMFKRGRLSEKQAYCLAKFAVETNQVGYVDQDDEDDSELDAFLETLKNR